jgi:hypothetical protein
MKLTVKQVEQLVKFRNNVSKLEFESIFSNKADYLWGKFESCDRDLLEFFNGLDTKYINLLTDYIDTF